ncbi:MAG: hypothetical protein PHX34_04135 [Candidatus Shapirobacteria bacterium]|nr:hypothetical protein [Candidatus Shapirobacteria bacterium]
MKKIIYILIITVILFGFYKLLSVPPKSNNSDTSVNTQSEIDSNDSDLIFYWGEGCPHCENVKEFIITNNVDQKVKINQKEVYKNTDNQQELQAVTSQYCPEVITNGGIGVPLAFDVQNKTCLSGDTPIIDFLKQKIQ